MSKFNGIPRPRGIIGGVQGGISVANLQQALETKGLTSANLAAALSSAPTSTSVATPAAPQAPNNTPSKS